jgi:hypothetical protein
VHSLVSSSLYLRSDINACRSACILSVEIGCISAEGERAIESSSSITPHARNSLCIRFTIIPRKHNQIDSSTKHQTNHFNLPFTPT